MKLFKKKENKQDGGEFIIKLALQEALRELEEEKEKSESAFKTTETLTKLNNENQINAEKKINDLENIITNKDTEIENLEKNIEVLQTTIENIRTMCKNKNGRVISSLAILKELGE